jgi:hypothetical protein
MVKYFVKKHCEATDTLCVATGRIQDYYYGKNCIGYVCKDREPKSFEGTLYGLDSELEAREILKGMQTHSESENLSGLWSVSLVVVEA